MSSVAWLLDALMTLAGSVLAAWLLVALVVA